MLYVHAMGMFDTVIFLDGAERICCAHGHRSRSLQTKDLEALSMSTYLVRDDEPLAVAHREVKRLRAGVADRDE
jgi:hypothetical protein